VAADLLVLTTAATIKQTSILLARTASRCQRAYILLLWFFISFLMPNLWNHWTDLNQTWTHIHLWLLFEKFGPNSHGD